MIGMEYCLTTEDGQDFHSKTKPILANGFNGGHKFVAHLFEEREDGFPSLILRMMNQQSFLVCCGPSVRHDGHIFCFIFKYRQRFKELCAGHCLFSNRH